jgi:hypothetical protein
MLPEYRVAGKEKQPCSSYTVRAGSKEERVTLDQDRQLAIRQ